LSIDYQSPRVRGWIAMRAPYAPPAEKTLRWIGARLEPRSIQFRKKSRVSVFESSKSP